MSGIRRRLKKAEDKLNMGEKHLTVNIVRFGGGELPPNHTSGPMTIHYVAYENVRRKKDQQSEA